MNEHEIEYQKNLERLKDLKEKKDQELMLPVSWLGQGKYFGELALTDDKDNPEISKVRAATVHCVQPCTFASLTKLEY